jgi:hypothetical protein
MRPFPTALGIAPLAGLLLLASPAFAGAGTGSEGVALAYPAALE